MKELSLHILDIIQNSISAKANNIYIKILEDYKENIFNIIIEDDGIGIKEDVLKNILDPFTTTRKTRKVGLGLSLFKATAIRSGGDLKIDSKQNIGTKVSVKMEYDNIDRPPLGNIEETLIGVINSCGNSINIKYVHEVNDNIFVLDTEEIKAIIEDIDINSSEVLLWLKEYIEENINNLY